jgi:hypothetical protein
MLYFYAFRRNYLLIKALMPPPFVRQQIWATIVPPIFIPPPRWVQCQDRWSPRNTRTQREMDPAAVIQSQKDRIFGWRAIIKDPIIGHIWAQDRRIIRGDINLLIFRALGGRRQYTETTTINRGNIAGRPNLHWTMNKMLKKLIWI